MLKKMICLCAACVVGLGLFCGCGNSPQGKFYTLQEAYDNGYLTQEDLMSIAYYNNGGRGGNEEIMAGDYAPFPKNPEVLSEETEQAIKETAARDLRNKGQGSVPEAKAEAFTVVKYYGNYHNCYAVMLNEPYFDFPAVEVDIWEEVGEVAFHITSFYEIKIWKK